MNRFDTISTSIFATVMLVMSSLPVKAMTCWNQTRDSFAAMVFRDFSAVSISVEKVKVKGAEDLFWFIETFADIRWRGWAIISYIPGKNHICLVLSGYGRSSDKEA